MLHPVCYTLRNLVMILLLLQGHSLTAVDVLCSSLPTCTGFSYYEKCLSSTGNLRTVSLLYCTYLLCVDLEWYACASSV